MTGPRKPLVRKRALVRRPIARTTGLKRGSKPLPTSNPANVAKRKKRQRSKHAKYMASQTRRDVEQRSGGRCERAADHSEYHRTYTLVTPTRCDAPATDHHHLTYARFGGRELLSDVMHLCKRCHDYYESQLPTRNRNYR